MPNILNTPTSPLFLLPGCVLVFLLAFLLLQGYRRSHEPALLWTALGFAGLAGLALWLGSYFVLLPAFLIAAVLYLRDGRAAKSPPSTVLRVAFRVQATQAHVRYGSPDALQDADVQGQWEQHLTATPGTPLVLLVQPGGPFAAEIWCDGQRLAYAAPPDLAPITLQAMARPAGTPSPLQR